MAPRPKDWVVVHNVILRTLDSFFAFFCGTSAAERETARPETSSPGNNTPEWGGGRDCRTKAKRASREGVVDLSEAPIQPARDLRVRPEAEGPMVRVPMAPRCKKAYRSLDKRYSIFFC